MGRGIRWHTAGSGDMEGSNMPCSLPGKGCPTIWANARGMRGLHRYLLRHHIHPPRQRHFQCSSCPWPRVCHGSASCGIVRKLPRATIRRPMTAKKTQLRNGHNPAVGNSWLSNGSLKVLTIPFTSHNSASGHGPGRQQRLQGNNARMETVSSPRAICSPQKHGSISSDVMQTATSFLSATTPQEA